MEKNFLKRNTMYAKRMAAKLRAMSMAQRLKQNLDKQEAKQPEDDSK